jgi:hypothetical protein
MGNTMPRRLKRSLAVIVCGLFLAALSYSGIATLSVMADPPRQRASSYLVVIPYDDIDGLQRLRPLNLHLLDLQADRLAAIVSPEELASLRSLGFNVRVLDAPATPELYYLVTPSPSGETAALHLDGQVFPYVEGAFLLKIDPVQAESHAIQGFSIQKLLGPIALPAMPSPAEVDATSIAIQEHDPLIQNLVDSVSHTHIYTTILELQDDDALPGWDAERSRYSFAPELTIERDYVRDRMATLGLDVRYHNFNTGGRSLDNIEGTLAGWGPGSDLIYVVCAHYDSVSEDAYNAAPGADDNASGVAGVLEAARVMSQYRYRHTLRFVTFAAEEQGLIGSYYYVADARSAGTDIGGAINLDMIAWDSNFDDAMEVHAGIRADSQALGAAFLDANTAYGISLLPEFITDGASTRSDHARFWNQGYPAILAVEDHQDFNPYYHRTSDTLDRLNLPYATKFVETTVATLAELAEIIPPGLSVEHTGPGAVMTNTLTSLMVGYANPGPNLATGVVITDTLSPGLTYLEDDSGFPVSQAEGGTIVWQVGDVNPHTRSSFVVTASVEATLTAGTYVTSSVEITGVTSWDELADNQATWTGYVPYLFHLPTVIKDSG